ncbi:DNA internalization-related competence protein ComEC/Rec2 [Evansella sp. LMS18]|jgi:competence protein ComEC|uniref:DNA internalization-related competence protein ComEC/Rec2 n=1 Tax=Evansella sp. LMS18 TaxID=2924033 RepID=UPI0020D0EDEC|nr:DNA internalization-related competence protein ComEC/Rec2 [Evansella sp. LMS18]UTR09332.1 DNA internalization-related competence protein ComEC/Rec2 [Evansella sp. LMS18]
MGTRTYTYAFLAVAGILVAVDGPGLWGVFFLLAGLFPLLAGSQGKMRKAEAVFTLLLFLLFYFHGGWYADRTTSLLTGTETYFAGQIITEPVITGSGQWSFQMKLNNGERTQVFLQENEKPPFFNDYCNFTGELVQPGQGRNPGSFNYRKYLERQGINWIIRPDYSEGACRTNNTTLMAAVLKFRKAGIEEIMEMDDAEASSLIAALVFGERSFLSADRTGVYQQLGILHLLAVSGLHTGLVAYSLYYLLCRIGVTRERSSFILISVLPVYIIVAGGAPSVVRASLMCMAVLAARQLKWKVKAVDTLSILCLMLLLYNPFYIFQLGFQLSFLTSFALILSYNMYKNDSPVFQVIKVTIVAQLISLPLILFHFYEISLLAVPFNLIFIPFISFWVLPLAFLTTALLFIFPAAASVSYYLISSTLRIIHTAADAAANWHWDMLVFGRPTGVMLILIVLSVLLFFTSFEKASGKNKVVSSLIVCFVLFLQLIHPYFDSKAVITMLDVGQGDAVVIELPFRKGIYLIDTGGAVVFGEETDVLNRKGPGIRALQPFLKEKGIKKIDKLIITHGHLDHMGDGCHVARLFPVKEIYFPQSSPPTESVLPLLQCMLETGSGFKLVSEGRDWKAGEAVFTVISPAGSEITENNRSVVLHAVIEEVAFLFNGDLEEEGEKRLISDYPDLSADILKAGHHGSRTSTTEEFLQHVSPKAVLISAGRNNLYGHPHGEVISRLEEHGIAVYRTDIQGAVEISLKGGRAYFRTITGAD